MKALARFSTRRSETNLPQEVIHLIFQFLTPEEATALMSTCQAFNAAGVDRLNRVLRDNGITLEVESLYQAGRALTLPLRQRITDLYFVVSELESFLRGEYWNLSPGGDSRFHASNTPSGWHYETSYLPLTLPDNHPARANTHFTTMTQDSIQDIRGEWFNLGHYLRYRTQGRNVQYRELVDAREMLQAVRDLIEWLGNQRHRFLTLPDGTSLAAPR